MVSSGIGFGENSTNARLVHAEAPRDLDLAPGVVCPIAVFVTGREFPKMVGKVGRVGHPSYLAREFYPQGGQSGLR
jgi:hypothetical protein